MKTLLRNRRFFKGILLFWIGLGIIGLTQIGMAGEVHLKYVVWSFDVAASKKVATEFEKKNPGIKVEVVEYSAQGYDQKLASDLAKGTDIDLFATKNNAQYSELVSKYRALDITNYITKDGYDVSGYGPLYEGIKIKGRVYGIPYRRTTWMLFYNKNLFDQAGITYPSSDMTWDDFRKLAKRLTQGKGKNKVWGANFHTWPTSSCLAGLQTGTTLVDKNLDAIADALQLRLDLQNDGSMMSYGEQIATNQHYGTAFQAGNICMNVIGDFLIGQLREAEAAKKMTFDWDIVPLPHPAGVSSNTSVGMPTCAHISQNSKSKAEAWRFLKYLAGPEGAKVFAADGTLPGFINPEVKKIYLETGGKNPKHLSTIFDQKVYVEFPPVPGINMVYNIYTAEIDHCFMGKQTPQQTIKTIKFRILKELKN